MKKQSRAQILKIGTAKRKVMLLSMEIKHLVKTRKEIEKDLGKVIRAKGRWQKKLDQRTGNI